MDKQNTTPNLIQNKESNLFFQVILKFEFGHYHSN